MLDLIWVILDHPRSAIVGISSFLKFGLDPMYSFGDIAIFYSASSLLAMQSAVLARGILSVCPSVRLSVTFQYCVQTNEDTIVRFSASGRTIPLVSGELKFILIFAGDHPQRGR